MNIYKKPSVQQQVLALRNNRVAITCTKRYISWFLDQFVVWYLNKGGWYHILQMGIDSNNKLVIYDYIFNKEGRLSSPKIIGRFGLSEFDECFNILVQNMDNERINKELFNSLRKQCSAYYRNR